MTVDPSTTALTTRSGAVPQLHLPAPPTGLRGQLVFQEACDAVLPRAQASGNRMMTALYLILLEHRGVLSGTGPDAPLTCASCRPEVRPPDGTYPCPTAQQAFWALDAVLR